MEKEDIYGLTQLIIMEALCKDKCTDMGIGDRAMVTNMKEIIWRIWSMGMGYMFLKRARFCGANLNLAITYSINLKNHQLNKKINWILNSNSNYKIIPDIPTIKIIIKESIIK